MIAKLVCNRQVATTSLVQAVSVEYTNIKTMLSRRYSIYSTGLYGYSVLQPTYDSWVAPCCTHSRRELFGAWLSLRRHVYESTGCGVQPASAAGASTASLFFETGAELKETVQVWVSLSTLNSCWGTRGVEVMGWLVKWPAFDHLCIVDYGDLGDPNTSSGRWICFSAARKRTRILSLYW